MVGKAETSGKKMTLGLWLIDKVNTRAWRAGKVTGTKHPDDIQDILNQIGKNALFAQAEALEKEGLILVDWKAVGHEISRIHFPVEHMDALCQREGVENPRTRLLNIQLSIENRRSLASAEWLIAYYDSLLEQLQQGNIPANGEDEKLLQVLDAISHLEHDVWKRVFSTKVLGSSKLFEQKYEERVLTILRSYSPLSREGMERHEILAEHKILTYSQTLVWKGPVVCQFDTGAVWDTSVMEYGVVVNAQTLAHIQPVGIESVRKIMTIENKANYESMPYVPDTLYIFAHGFFSPKERGFLRQLERLAMPGTEFLHWGDMDFGGIRIFQFIQNGVFSRVKPYRMDREAYCREVDAGHNSLIALTKEKRVKLEKLEAGELEELKGCILERGYEIEQEVQLIYHEKAIFQ